CPQRDSRQRCARDDVPFHVTAPLFNGAPNTCSPDCRYSTSVQNPRCAPYLATCHFYHNALVARLSLKAIRDDFVMFADRFTPNRGQSDASATVRREEPPQLTFGPSPFATSPSRAKSSRSSFAISACVLLAPSVPCSSNCFFASGKVTIFAIVALSL